MEKFSEILKQFTSSQRLFVLILLLIFSSGTYLATSYLKVDDCQPVIEKNKELINYIVQIQNLILIYKNEGLNEGLNEGINKIVMQAPNNNSVLDSIMNVTKKAINNEN